MSSRQSVYLRERLSLFPEGGDVESGVVQVKAQPH